MGYRKEVLQLDSFIHNAGKQLPDSFITPTNIASVKKKLSTKIFNPQLQYKYPDDVVFKLRRQLANLKIKPRSYTEKLVEEKRAQMVTKLDMLYKLGSQDMSDESKKVYPLPSKKLVDHAYELLDVKGTIKKPEKVGAKDAENVFRANFKMLQLPYKIQRMQMVNSCFVNPSKKLLALKKKARFSRSFVNRLVAHEIGVHVFRYENGGQHKLHIFQDGVANYLTTEEGLAAYNEKRLGVSKISTLKNYASRVIAVHMAQHNDFVTTYKELRRFTNRSAAIQTTLRAKRGLCDTSEAGGFTKDSVYLKGLREVEQYLKKKGSFKKLFTGKIRTQDVAHLRKISLKQPKYFDQELIFLEKSSKDAS